MSANISYCLQYGQNPEKGGECIFYNCLDPTMSPAEQAEDWKAMSKDYKYKVCQLILSFGEKDTARLRQMENATERLKLERQIVAAFFKELAAKGNDISKSAYGVFHHGNTDNEHFHAYVLMTDLEGRRWNNSFINKNATRAAAKVSIDFGLEGSPKAMRRELAHQKHMGQARLQATPEDNRKRKYGRTVDADGHIHRDRGTTDDASVMSDRLRRQRAAQEAEKRKRQYKYLIEKASEGCDARQFLSNVSAMGIQLFLDPRLGISMAAIGDDGKEHRYSLRADLNIDVDVLPQGLTQLLQTDYVHTADKKKAEQRADSAPRKAESPITSTTVHAPTIPQSKVARALNAGGGSDQNREYEVGGHSSSSDDLDEQWKRRNGMHY